MHTHSMCTCECWCPCTHTYANMHIHICIHNVCHMLTHEHWYTPPLVHRYPHLKSGTPRQIQTNAVHHESPHLHTHPLGDAHMHTHHTHHTSHTCLGVKPHSGVRKASVGTLGRLYHSLALWPWVCATFQSLGFPPYKSGSPGCPSGCQDERSW